MAFSVFLIYFLITILLISRHTLDVIPSVTARQTIAVYSLSAILFTYDYRIYSISSPVPSAS